MALGIPTFILGLIVVGYWYFSGSAKPPSSVADEQIPMSATASGVVAALDCVGAGASECANIDSAKSYLTSLSGGRPLTARVDDAHGATYPAFASVSPGGDAAAWESFAATATLGGQAGPSFISESEFHQVSPGVVEFSVPSSGTGSTSWIGHMSFTSEGDQIRLAEITYVAGSGG